MLTARTILDQKGGTIHSVNPDATVLEALRTMDTHNCGALLVLEGTRPIGMLSERDYARKVALKGRTSKTTPVREVMDENVINVPITLAVDQCMAIMTERRSRYLLVRDSDKIAGLISIGDVVKAVIDDQKFTIDQLEHYITGA